jgi:hypothetical protein
MPIKKLPLQENCFQCQKEVLVKFCPPLKSYVKKNNWGYWTEKEEYNEQYICSDCLKNLYYTDYYVNLRNQF